MLGTPEERRQPEAVRAVASVGRSGQAAPWLQLGWGQDAHPARLPCFHTQSASCSKENKSKGKHAGDARARKAVNHARGPVSLRRAWHLGGRRYWAGAAVAGCRDRQLGLQSPEAEEVGWLSPLGGGGRPAFSSAPRPKPQELLMQRAGLRFRLSFPPLPSAGRPSAQEP